MSKKAAEPANKSEAIREYIKANRIPKNAAPQTIAEGLAKQGVEVSTGLVYQVQRKLRGGNKPSRGAKKTAKKSTRSKPAATRRRQARSNGSTDAGASLVGENDTLARFVAEQRVNAALREILAETEK